MKKKERVENASKSLRTFFLYFTLVLVIIIISLSIKAVYIWKDNKFDGSSIEISISKKNNLVGIIGFNSAGKSISYLDIKGPNIQANSTCLKIGIIAEGKFNSDSEIDKSDILSGKILLNNFATTNLTIFDKLRLYLLAKNIYKNDQKVDEINLENSESQIDRILLALFAVDQIKAENTSIEIINATSEPGLGKKVERCFTNIGANVISISTPHEYEKKSRIEYNGSQNYTLNKIKKLLGFPVTLTNEKKIADITITIGENYKSSGAF